MSCLPVLDRSLVLARPLQVVSLLQQTVFSLHSGSFEEDLLGYCVHSYRLQEAKKSDLKSEKEENELFTLGLVFKYIFIQDFLISLCHYVKTCPKLITRKRSLVMEFNVLITRSLTKVALMYFALQRNARQLLYVYFNVGPQTHKTYFFRLKKSFNLRILQ